VRKMRKVLVGLTIMLGLLIFIDIGYAGLMMGENEVHLKTFEEYDICFGVWTGRSGITHHEVSASDEIIPFISSISPTKFELEPVPCPGESKARRECIKQLCMNGTIKYCQLVCITFKGPFRVALFPEEEYYEGSVKDVSKKGSATTVIPYTMKVYYTPYDLKIILVVVGVIITSIILVIYLWKTREKPKEKISY